MPSCIPILTIACVHVQCIAVATIEADEAIASSDFLKFMDISL